MYTQGFDCVGFNQMIDSTLEIGYHHLARLGVCRVPPRTGSNTHILVELGLQKATATFICHTDHRARTLWRAGCERSAPFIVYSRLLGVVLDNQPGFQLVVCLLLKDVTRAGNLFRLGHTVDRNKLVHVVFLEALHVLVYGFFPLLVLRRLNDFLAGFRDFGGVMFPVPEAFVKRSVRDAHKHPWDMEMCSTWMGKSELSAVLVWYTLLAGNLE